MKRLVCIGLIICISSGVKAQYLSLNEAITIALKNSLDIEIAKNDFEANQITNHLSIAGGVPVVTASFNDNQSFTNLNQKLSNGTTITRSGNSSNSFNSGITASYLLYNGYRVRFIKSRLEALEKQSSFAIIQQIQNLVASVMVKYYDIVRQGDYLKTIQQSIDVTMQRKKLVDARQGVGLANNADTYQAQLDLTASNQDYASQQLILDQAKVDLLTLLTLKPDSTVYINDTIVVDKNVDIQAVKASLINNPVYLTADQQILINDLIVKQTGALRYPAVTINTGYNYIRSQNAAGFTLLNQNFGPFAGLGIQVPIFNGGAAKRQLNVAKIDVENARYSRDIVLNNLENAAVTAWLAYQNNLQRLETEKKNNKIAYDLLSLVEQRFQLGVGTIVDVREAQKSFVDAGFRLINLSYAAKVAEIELKRLGGQLAQ